MNNSSGTVLLLTTLPAACNAAGKAFNSFFFGADRYRHELTYKGQGG